LCSAKEINASPNPEEVRQKKIEEYRKKYANPYIAAKLGIVDDVSDPRETRIKLVQGLEMLKDKKEERPKKKHGNIPPRLYAKSTVENEIAASQTVEKKLEQSKQQKPLTKEEKLIQHFEAITHRELLEDLSPSGKASIDEINMITDIMEQHGLTQPVMNVLIDYVLKRSSNKLNQKFIDRVAASWSREGIKTAKEAFKVAKRDYQQFKTGKQKQPTRKQSARKGVVPEWYDEQKKKQEEQYLKPSKTASKEDIEKKQEELEAFFKQFK